MERIEVAAINKRLKCKARCEQIISLSRIDKLHEQCRYHAHAYGYAISHTQNNILEADNLHARPFPHHIKPSSLDTVDTIHSTRGSRHFPRNNIPPMPQHNHTTFPLPPCLHTPPSLTTSTTPPMPGVTNTALVPTGTLTSTRSPYAPPDHNHRPPQSGHMDIQHTPRQWPNPDSYGGLTTNVLYAARIGLIPNTAA